MKKLATLVLAAGLVFCSVTGASAIDFKAKGQWIMSFDYGQGGDGYSDLNGGGNTVVGSGFGSGSPDNFNATQRVRLQLEAVASESLSGTVYFEIGNSNWGDNAGGAALGADRTVIEVKQAYLDWVVPNTDVKVRMGIQGLSLPSFTSGTQVFAQDVAGIVVSNKFNDNVALTAFWARPYNDNYSQTTTSPKDSWSNYLDNADAFGLVLPLTFDGFTAVPWVTYMAVGQNVARGGAAGNAATGLLSGLLPFNPSQGTVAALNRTDMYDYGNVWHVGLTGDITMADPFRLAWDFNYGSADFGSSTVPLAGGARNVELKRSGFYLSLLAEYKMDWGTPGLYGWYSSGDDDDVANGSERMPVIQNGNSDNKFSQFASNGNPYLAREGVLGNTLIGTWGLGVRVKDFSFVEDLKHTFRFNYFGGTNSTDMAKFAVANPGLVGANANAAFNQTGGMYLTTADSAFEFGLTSDYQIYENLKLYVDMAYLVLDFSQDKDVWNDTFTATDAFNINASFVYSF